MAGQQEGDNTQTVLCSFCRKDRQSWGPFAEGPDHVYICYECVLLCKAIIEAECDRKGILPWISRPRDHGHTP